MDEFLILLQAKLDEAKSKGNVNADIEKIQNQIDKLKLQAEIDPKTISTLTKQLENILNQKIVISNIGIDQGNAVKIGKQTGQQIGNAINQEVESSIKKADSILKSFSQLKIGTGNINAIVDKNGLVDVEKSLNKIKQFYSEFGQVKITDMSFDSEGTIQKFKVNIEQVNGELKETRSFVMALNGTSFAFPDDVIKGSESIVQHLDKTKNVINETGEAINNLALKTKIDKIQLLMDNGYGASEYQNRINTITASLEKYGVEAEEAKKITSSLQSTFDSMKGLSGQELVTHADKLEQEFKSVKASVEQAKLSYDKLMQPASKEKISSTLLKVQKFLDNNTKVTENVKNEWQSYVNRLSSGSDIAVKEINDINIRLKQTESNMRSMGKLGLSWTDKLTQAWEKFGGWGFATGTMMTVINQLRQIPKEVYAIDTAMTNLYKVTDETDKKYQDFLNSAKSSAVEIGSSVSSLIEQTANWAKLGFDINTASTLAKTSSIYANVGEVDDATAVSDIVTAIKAFNIEASDSITIVDKFNKLGNEFATDAKSLGDGLSRSASAMATAGTDINKTLAMLTGGTEITQNASEFGNFLKVGSMRIRGMKGQLEQLGEEVDETVDSISKVQTQILNRTGGKVNIFDDNDNFRDYYEIMEDISKVFNDLNDPDKADLTEILFGKQRGNQGAALIQAFQSGQIQKAYEAALNAEGSAMQEQERWMGSLEAKLQQFKASFQSFSDTVVNSDLLKWFVDLGKTGVNSLNALFKALGSVGMAGLGSAGVSAFLGRDKSKQRFCPLWM